ncbi:efflux RND transporter periplasmic adaptor subunit [Burkholderia territorii]|uniref:efflux RND transporter periplasmic adaptor subunit n=1 Tax=Burkholderia territorii TaxID=1503055 RepID=UPI001E564379|nr:efflux RND transporter periplasmic adaptor subunit [Burkholderia territorii]
MITFAALVWRFGHESSTQPYLTAPVTRMNIEATVLATGTLHPSQQTTVNSRVTGPLTSLHVKIGDHVRRGQILAEVDSANQRNDLQAAAGKLADLRAQRDARRATLRQHQHEAQRQAYLLAHDASTSANLEMARTDAEVSAAGVRSLDAQIVVAQAVLESAHVNLSNTRVAAPIDGEILSIKMREGQIITATAPTILSIGRLDQMTVQVRIPEADVVRVKPGMPVHFTVLGLPDQRFEGALRTIEPEVMQSESQQRSAAESGAIYYNGLFDVLNPARLLYPSMTAQVSILIGRANDTLTVPAAALSRRLAPDRFEVHVLQANGRVASRIVKIGITNDTSVQVLDGLKEHENVIIGNLESVERTSK